MARKKQRYDFNVCTVVKTALGVVFTLMMIASILAMIESHNLRHDPLFGTAEGSMSVLAVVLTLIYWTKHTDCSPMLHKPYQQIVVQSILIVSIIVATIDFVQAHFIEGKLVFGTLEGTLAIVAFAVSAKHCAKHIAWICDVTFKD